MTTGTRAVSSVPERTPDQLAHDARVLREAFTRCRRDVSCPQTDARVRNMGKRFDHDRSHSVEILVTLLYDAKRRGAPQSVVEAPVRALLAYVQSWDGSTNTGDLLTLVRAETTAQASADVAEFDLAIAQTPKAVADATDALGRHLCALEQLVAALDQRRLQAA